MIFAIKKRVSHWASRSAVCGAILYILWIMIQWVYGLPRTADSKLLTEIWAPGRTASAAIPGAEVGIN